MYVKILYNYNACVKTFWGCKVLNNYAVLYFTLYCTVLYRTVVFTIKYYVYEEPVLFPLSIYPVLLRIIN